jgi:hypothetical protein
VEPALHSVRVLKEQQALRATRSGAEAAPAAKTTTKQKARFLGRDRASNGAWKGGV